MKKYMPNPLSPPWDRPDPYPMCQWADYPAPTPGTQKARILDKLIENWTRGVCGNVFLEMGIARYSARIYELRADGWPIWSQLCESHGRVPYRHESNVWQFGL